MRLLLAVFITAATASAVLVEGIRLWARRHHVLDHPNARSSHDQPTPRGGGLAIVVVTIAGMAILRVPHFFAVAMPSLLIAAISFIDDLRGSSWLVRLSAHLAAAIAAIGVFGFWSHVQLPHVTIALGLVGAFVTLLWIVGLTNGYNFMDGIDGIAGLQAVIAGIGWTFLAARFNVPIISTAGALLAGSSFGFLIHNWQPARIFMGDVGSAFLGYMFATLGVIAAAHDPRFAAAAVLLVWPFVYDTSFTLILRIRRGERLSQAHRSHLYQRLIQTGTSHARISALYGALALLGVASAWAQFESMPLAVMGIATVLAAALMLTVGVMRREAGRNARHPRMETKPRRLLFVVNHAGFFVSHRLPVALEARDAGYDVHIATPASKHVPLITETGLTWHEVRLSRSGLHPISELRSFLDLVRLYRALRPDLVHHVTSKPVLYGTLAARVCHVPAVVNAISGLGHVFATERKLTRLIRAGVSTGYRLVLRHPAMRIIFQNEEQRETFISSRWCASEQAVLIPGSGADTDRFTPREGTHPGPVRVLLASRMLHTKGVADFVAAARHLHDQGLSATFVLAGEPDPDNPASITDTILRDWHDSGAIEYLGRRTDMPNVMAESDVVCLPTYYSEGVPKVLVEAAAAGLPIVTTDWPGCREIVTDGFNGLLVPIRDPEKLAAALARLIENPDLRAEMGRRGRERALGRYSLDSVIRMTLAIYTELCG